MAPKRRIIQPSGAKEEAERQALTRELEGFRPQKPYRNGVTLYRGSYWGGNGVGDITRIKAVYRGRIIGEYLSTPTSVSSVLEGHSEQEFAPELRHLGPFIPGSDPPQRELRTTRTRYSKWLTAVKAWLPDVAEVTE